MNYRKWSIVSRILSLLSCVFLLIGLLSQPRNVAMLVLGIFFMTAGFTRIGNQAQVPRVRRERAGALRHEGGEVPEVWGEAVTGGAGDMP